MTYGIHKPMLAALMAGGLVAGCATTVDMGGPLGHYSYYYDSRPVVSESITVPTVTYRTTPTVTYRTTPTVTYRTTPTVTYQTTPTVTYPTTPTVTYQATPSVTYATPSVTYETTTPTATYRERIVYRDPTLRYDEPTATYALNPSPFTDKGQ
jgi:hypothetical protein